MQLRASSAARAFQETSWAPHIASADAASGSASRGAVGRMRRAGADPAGTVPPLLRALGARGTLFIVADERTPSGRGGGRIPLVALGGGVRPGAVDRARVDHRALLATIEDVLGLGRLPDTRTAPTVRGLLKG